MRLPKLLLPLLILYLFNIEPSPTWAMPSRPIQLTDNIHADETPQIDGQRIVWVHDDGHDGEIYRHEGISTRPLTNDDYVYSHPQVSEFGITFVSSDRYVVLFDGSWKTLFDSGWTVSNFNPQISGLNAVWDCRREVYFYDGTSSEVISTGSGWNFEAQISGTRAIWVGKTAEDADYDIFFYNGGQTVQVTDNEFDDRLPQIAGPRAAWQGYDGNDWEIFLNGNQITDNDYDDVSPQLSESLVTWVGYDDADAEIFVYDNEGTTTKLTDNTYDDLTPKVSGSTVVWSGKEGGVFGDAEIFVHDGNDVTKITDNLNDDISPQISGGNIVWQGDDGQDWEIYLAILDPTLGDVNRDGIANGLDVDFFVDVLLGDITDPVARFFADVNGDGEVNGVDVDPFVVIILGTQSVQAIPEPSALILAALAFAVVVTYRRRCRKQVC